MVYSPVFGSRRETVSTCQFCVVHLHGVAAVVVARPAGLLAEQRVLRDALRGAMAVLQLPRAQQLVNILCGQALEVFLHDLELLEARCSGASRWSCS